MHHVWTIARFVWLELWRGRLWLILTIIPLSAFFAGRFASHIALTDSVAINVAISAASARLIAVIVVCLLTVAHCVREQQDKTLDWMLSMPMSRAHYLFGKWLGFCGLVLLATVLAALPLLTLVPLATLAWWMTTLFAELAIMMSFALFVGITFSQVPTAVVACLGFYWLSRSISAMVLMIDNPILPEATLSTTVMQYVTHGLAAVLPSLDRFADARNLLDATSVSFGSELATHAALYLLLLLSATLLDLYRKEL